MGQSKVYDNFALGMLEGLIFGDSLFSAKPLYDLIDKQFGSESELPQDKKKEDGAMLNIGIANLHNGTFVGFNEKFKTRDLVKVLKASVAYPAVFEPFDAWNSSWVSGSAIWNIDAAAPILRCKALGYSEEDIVIDAILDNADEIEQVDVSTYNAFHMVQRSLEVMNYFTARQGLGFAQQAFPKVTFRHVVGPKSAQWYDLESMFNNLLHHLIKWIPVSYSERDVRTLFARGQADAKAVLDKNRGVTGSNFQATKVISYKGSDL